MKKFAVAVLVVCALRPVAFADDYTTALGNYYSNQTQISTSYAAMNNDNAWYNQMLGQVATLKLNMTPQDWALASSSLSRMKTQLSISSLAYAQANTQTGIAKSLLARIIAADGNPTAALKAAFIAAVGQQTNAAQNLNYSVSEEEAFGSQAQTTIQIYTD